MSAFQGFSPRQRSLILIGVVTVATLVLGALAEGAVRLRHWTKFGDLWGIESTYTTDDASGMRIPVPGGRFGPIEINSRGFRGPEIPVPKPPKTVRLAFLGASTTYCAEVSGNDKVWAHLIVEDLRARWPGVTFDYVNGGVPGFGVNSSIRNLVRRIRPLAPNVVIIYHASNDLSSNSFQLASAQGIVAERTEAGLSWPSQYSLLWYLVEKNLLILSKQRQALEETGKLSVDPDQLAKPFRDDLTHLVQESARNAPLVAVATFSARLRRDQSPEDQVRAAVTSLYYMPYMSIAGLLDGFEAYNRVIRRVAEENGALLISGENEIPGDAVHFADSYHFTDAGSRAMADRVTGALLASQTFRDLIESR